MKRRIFLLFAFLTLPSAKPAAADNKFIVRSNLGAQLLSQVCLLHGCTVVRSLDGTLNQVFLLTAPDLIDPTVLLNLLRATPGILDAELDQLISLVGGLNKVTTIPAGLSDTTPVPYFGSSVWNGYANQPAAGIVRVAQAQSTFQVAGIGIVADIDTGVDPTHPALQAVLLPGYDFTRNQANGSELTDFAQPPPSGNPPAPAQVNQSTAAVLDQSTAAVLDGNVQYSAFGHGTMVMGVIHLVAPQAHLLPLKAFRADGSAFLSDILSAIYYAAQNNANVINMSFDLKINSQELSDALDYASQLNVICVASAGNDGMQEIVYPAGYTNTVMGVASTDDVDNRSSFSNFGNAVVWVAAPGEAIITTYPFDTYSAGWGTSFSAPFVSGTSALFHQLQPGGGQGQAAQAISHAQPIGPTMGNGRLDIFQALQSVHSTNMSSDFAVSAGPSNRTVTAGETTSFSASIAPIGGFSRTVTWTCAGAPRAATCSVSPSSVTLDGSTNANVTVTIQTTGRPSAAVFVVLSTLPPGWPAFAVCIACLAILGLCLKIRVAPDQHWRFGVAAVTLLASVCASCGGGASVTPPATQGTPAGISTITITGTCSSVSPSISHSSQVTLTVN
jgi:Subtilase family